VLQFTNSPNLVPCQYLFLYGMYVITTPNGNFTFLITLLHNGHCMIARVDNREESVEYGYTASKWLHKVLWLLIAIYNGVKHVLVSHTKCALLTGAHVSEIRDEILTFILHRFEYMIPFHKKMKIN